MSDRLHPGGRDCQCYWPDLCGGTGILRCEGCGGDTCICRCGGTMPCPGCDDCEDIEV